jgi:hypothetical protein
MVFQFILANLLANNDRAVGVLFLDGTGETVDLACSEFTPYDMRIVGATSASTCAAWRRSSRATSWASRG